MDSRILISFVRHGDVFNPENVFYGRLPRFRLSEAGLHQARMASAFFHEKKIDAIFSSPLLRAKQTAGAILAAHSNLALRQSKLLLEVYTPFDGQPKSELIKRNWDVYSEVPLGYEQPLDVIYRAFKFVSMVRQKYKGQNVVAVTHGDSIAFLILWARSVPVNQKNKQDLRQYGIQDKYPEPGSIVTLEFRTDKADEIPALEYHSSS